MLKLTPGIAFAVSIGGLCVAAGAMQAWLSPLLLALLIGIAMGNLGLVGRPLGAGVAFTARQLLRAGVVLLGLQLSFTSIVALGWSGLGVLVTTVVVTFTGTLLLGRLIRVSSVGSYLIAAGFSICGASAIVAMSSVVDPDQRSEEEAAQAIALVSLFGTLCIVAIPLLAGLLDLGEASTALWIGASVHEVAQVVAAGSLVSATALAIATIAKLGRVVLLAPLLAVVSVVRSRMSTETQEAPPRLVPLFVLAFIAAVVVRSVVPLPVLALDGARLLSTLLLAAAMFGMGAGVDLRRMIATGLRPFLLGGSATILAAGSSLSAILLLA